MENKVKRSIAIHIATFNEEENVGPLYDALIKVIEDLEADFDFTILFIDNNSTDTTQDIIRSLCSRDRRVKAVFNEHNYGGALSSYSSIDFCDSDALIMMCADFQDPPSLLPELLEMWKLGHLAVMAKKRSSHESRVLKLLRHTYYKFLSAINPSYRQIINCTGFGIYDKEIISRVRSIHQSKPFFRALVAETYSSIAHVEYDRPKRYRGISSMNLLKLYDEGVVGLVQNSMYLIRFILFLSIVCALFCVIAALGMLVVKVLFWESIPIGIAPIFITQLFIGSLILSSLAIIGEYIGLIASQVRSRPLTFIREKINVTANKS